MVLEEATDGNAARALLKPVAFFAMASKVSASLPKLDPDFMTAHVPLTRRNAKSTNWTKLAAIDSTDKDKGSM